MIVRMPVLCFEGGLFIWGLAGMSSAVRPSINRVLLVKMSGALQVLQAEKHSSHCGWHASHNVLILSFSMRVLKFAFSRLTILRIIRVKGYSRMVATGVLSFLVDFCVKVNRFLSILWGKPDLPTANDPSKRLQRMVAA
jgi:hypothetical protein